MLGIESNGGESCKEENWRGGKEAYTGHEIGLRTLDDTTSHFISDA